MTDESSSQCLRELVQDWIESYNASTGIDAARSLCAVSTALFYHGAQELVIWYIQRIRHHT